MDKEINIKKLLNIIRNRLWILIIVSIISTTLGGLYSFYITNPLYKTSSKLIVNTDDKLMNTLMVMIKEPGFLEHVVKEMDLNTSPEELSQRISAGSIGGSSIVEISVIDSKPEKAADIANIAANVFKREMEKTFGLDDIRIYSEAKINSAPININHGNKIVLSFIIGIIAGMGLIFLLDFMDNTVRTESLAEQLLEAPVLGNVSKMNKKTTAQKKNIREKIGIRRHSLETNKE
ncbi:YveK family protein [Bacillus sp. B-jedd]|uniref:YveK family protein n=1 Tax=Bacillus sp. B-jedd TaxID=1476857 RepID=UPI00051555AB|nr:Wzz/FepE/Etk N-terminal domain-containing protein [Bacillus sp. B-jedd]CEG28655.1 lipopolysaccharide biosynthesis protein [Bacillus sp. B-jedd]